MARPILLSAAVLISLFGPQGLQYAIKVYIHDFKFYEDSKMTRIEAKSGLNENSKSLDLFYLTIIHLKNMSETNLSVLTNVSTEIRTKQTWLALVI